jgi:thiamine biosynthesis lipoprotein
VREVTTDDRRSWVEQVMGMPVSLLARGPGAGSAEADAVAQRVYAELREVDARFSTYQEGSEVSRVGRGELALADSHPDVREVARRCDAAKERTGGLFDAHRPDGGWDPSGLVKGWAVERAARHLTGGALDWCLNAGGDVVAVCPSGEPFAVGVQDPHDDSRLVAVVPLATGGVATSGTAARGAHLYDPRGGDVDGLASVTVTGPSLETADVLATAAFVAGSGALDLVAAEPGYSALVVTREGTRRSGRGWPGRLPL